MREFLAGKIDLVQAEAVLGVIEADDHPWALDGLAHGFPPPGAASFRALAEISARLAQLCRRAMKLITGW